MQSAVCSPEEFSRDFPEARQLNAVTRWLDWSSCRAAMPDDGRLFIATSSGGMAHVAAKYKLGDGFLLILLIIIRVRMV